MSVDVKCFISSLFLWGWCRAEHGFSQSWVPKLWLRNPLPCHPGHSGCFWLLEQSAQHYWSYWPDPVACLGSSPSLDRKVLFLSPCGVFCSNLKNSSLQRQHAGAMPITVSPPGSMCSQTAPNLMTGYVVTLGRLLRGPCQDGSCHEFTLLTHFLPISLFSDASVPPAVGGC